MGTPNTTSSPASAGGVMRYDLQAGRTTDQSGPAPALANLSARQAKEAGRMMSGTYGPRSTTSSRSFGLQSFLASRLRAGMASIGSTLYRLTWKERITPSGRPICALRASVLRISGNGFTSWPTPTARDAVRGAKDARPWDTGKPLNQITALTGWVTASSRDWKDSPGMATERKGGRGRLDQLPRQAQLTRHVEPRTRGEIPNGSTAGTTNYGQLNPAHPRWLMGYPQGWDDCAVTAMPSSRKLLRPSSPPPATPCFLRLGDIQAKLCHEVPEQAELFA